MTMLPQDLENWLTDAFGHVLRKAAGPGPLSVLDAHEDLSALDPGERLLYELWLLDAEQQNGGVSQYFANHGPGRWRALSAFAAPALPSFPRFAAKVDEVVDGEGDAFEAIINSGVDLDGWYDEHRIRLVSELQAAVRPGAG